MQLQCSHFQWLHCKGTASRQPVVSVCCSTAASMPVCMPPCPHACGSSPVGEVCIWFEQRNAVAVALHKIKAWPPHRVPVVVPAQFRHGTVSEACKLADWAHVPLASERTTEQLKHAAFKAQTKGYWPRC